MNVQFSIIIIQKNGGVFLFLSFFFCVEITRINF